MKKDKEIPEEQLSTGYKPTPLTTTEKREILEKMGNTKEIKEDDLFRSQLPLETITPKFKTNYNKGNYNGEPGEINNQPSMTVPEQTMSIREILTRYTHGLPITSTQRVPIFDGEEEVPDFAHMDLAELQQFRDQTIQELLQIKSRKDKREAEQAQKAQDKLIDSLIEQKLRDQQQIKPEEPK